MPSMFVLLNHHLTPSQEQEAKDRLQIDRIEYPPTEIQNIWNNIPPEREDIAPLISPICQWLETHSCSNDYIIVQGDCGATFMVVEWALRNGRIPLYSTTARRYESSTDESGNVINVHTFRHVIFRKYKRLS